MANESGNEFDYRTIVLRNRLWDAYCYRTYRELTHYRTKAPRFGPIILRTHNSYRTKRCAMCALRVIGRAVPCAVIGLYNIIGLPGRVFIGRGQ